MPIERAIQAATFILLLVGLCSLSAWVSYRFLQNDLILQVAAVALGWGTILLVLYALYRTLHWDWWT